VAKKLEEIGDHNKLMRLRGFYAELFEQQKIESELEREEDELLS